MEEPKNKYILLVDRVGKTWGKTSERSLLALGLLTKASPTQVLRGELLEALPEAEQPSDVNRIALVGIDCKSLRLECRKEDLTRLLDEEVNLLLAIHSQEARFQTFYNDRKRLDFGRRLSHGKEVFVSVTGFANDLPGVVWYKGELPSCPGTMFGIELIENRGQGKTDGTFRNKRYFTCPSDSGVFVGIDEVTPREGPDSKSAPKSLKRDGNAQANFKGRIERKSQQEKNNCVLEIDQRVVTFIEDHPARGTVRYIGEERDGSGNVHTIVGLKMDERVGNGTGSRNGQQFFFCRKDFAMFVDIQNVTREEDFDENHEESSSCTGKITLDKQDVIQEQIRRDGRTPGRETVRNTQKANSVNAADVITAAGESSQTDPTALIEQQRQLLKEVRLPRENNQQEENSKRQVSKMEQQAKGMKPQLIEKRRRLRSKEILEQPRKHKQEPISQKQLREIQPRLKEKDEQGDNLRRQLREVTQQLRRKDEQGDNLERGDNSGNRKRTQNVQRQLREIEQQRRGKDEQEEHLQRQLRDMERQLKNSQGQCREKEEETVRLQQRITRLERQLRVKNQQVQELEITLSTAQQALSGHQRRQLTTDWIISRDQIQLTDKLLGRGGWGSVVEGKYCGCSVAVKQIHELILSQHNRALFAREMDIASRCRHPCLLQFIGATNDEGSPLFLTELMESSLRALLEERPLAATEVSTISLDVAGAVNYLHHKKPCPIIHRDISSANVLLWRQGDQWRGKVSDYGTANFMQHTMTVGPGATMYMAPEAQTSNQTIKVDVYSFGVLLCEMCIQELPDPERRDQQIAMVTNRLLRALIRGCVQREPAARPNMEEVIEELENPV